MILTVHGFMTELCVSGHMVSILGTGAVEGHHNGVVKAHSDGVVKVLNNGDVKGNSDGVGKAHSNGVVKVQNVYTEMQ
jgi:hypothetical protein